MNNYPIAMYPCPNEERHPAIKDNCQKFGSKRRRQMYCLLPLSFNAALRNGYRSSEATFTLHLWLWDLVGTNHNRNVNGCRFRVSHLIQANCQFDQNSSQACAAKLNFVIIGKVGKKVEHKV